ncbi:hypothetical protein K7W42_17570 [Deinococcus sp. HMF7604]|nr:hypothetical protein [Deinococcus betulae]MBZ9752655.1 hypothetical protein [Deinococcus betulae]
MLSEGEQAASLVFGCLKPGGTLRVAVLDGGHPDPAYRALVGVHARPPGS